METRQYPDQVSFNGGSAMPYIGWQGRGRTQSRQGGE